MVFRVALIGCGNIGAVYDENNAEEVHTHAGMYRALDGFDLCAAADSNRERLKAFGSHWGVESLHADATALMRAEAPDIVSIATPDETHAGILRSVLSAGNPKLIFMEKPIAQDVRTAEELIRLCRERNSHLLVDYVRRWDDNHRAVREFLRDGGIGKLIGATGYYVRGIRHNGCQLINLMRFLLGEIESVQATGAGNLGSIPGDPTLNVRLEFSNGIEATILGLDRQGYAFSMFELDIFGAEGRLRIDETGSRISLWRAGTNLTFANFKHLVPEPSPWRESTYHRSLLNAGREMLDLLGGREERSINDADEAAQDLRVIEAAITSSLRGNGVESVAVGRP